MNNYCNLYITVRVTVLQFIMILRNKIALYAHVSTMHELPSTLITLLAIKVPAEHMTILSS